MTTPLKFRKEFLPHQLNVLATIALLLLSFCIDREPAFWKGFADPYDYLGQSKLSLLDPDFYFPPKPGVGAARPFTVPLIYKMAGNEIESIITCQQIFYALASGYLVFTLLLWIRNKWVGLALVATMHLFFSWWNLLGWTIVVLSESLSLSFAFLWIGSLLHYLKHPVKATFILHISITIFFAFTRDNWPYILTLFYLLLIICSFILGGKLSRPFMAFVATAVCLVFVQHFSAKKGERFSVPMQNTFVTRILTNHSYYQWFIDRGLPANPRLFTRYYNINTLNDTSRLRLYAFHADTACNDVKTWLTQHGQSAYATFLVTHPAYAFLKEEPKEQLRAFSACNLYFYINYPKAHSKYVDAFFPLFPYWLAILLSLICASYAFRTRTLILCFPFVWLLMTGTNAWLSFLADSLETERHLLMTNILVHLSGYMSTALLLNLFIEKQTPAPKENITGTPAPS